MKFLLSFLFCFGLVAEGLAHDGKSYWYEWIAHRGLAPYSKEGAAYPVYRNVMTYGAKGKFPHRCFVGLVLTISR